MKRERVREKEGGRKRGTVHGIEHRTEIQKANDSSSEKRPTTICPERNLVHGLVWVTSVRGTNRAELKPSAADTKTASEAESACTGKETKQNRRQISALCDADKTYYGGAKSQEQQWVCHFQSLPCSARGLTERGSRQRSGSGRGGLESKRGSVTGREGGTGQSKVSN